MTMLVRRKVDQCMSTDMAVPVDARRLIYVRT